MEIAAPTVSSRNTRSSMFLIKIEVPGEAHDAWCYNLQRESGCVESGGLKVV